MSPLFVLALALGIGIPLGLAIFLVTSILQRKHSPTSNSTEKPDQAGLDRANDRAKTTSMPDTSRPIVESENDSVNPNMRERT